MGDVLSFTTDYHIYAGVKRKLILKIAETGNDIRMQSQAL